MTPVTIHDQTYEYYSWETMGQDIFEVAKKILESGKKFDRIIALAKGGLAFSRSLVDYLEVDNISTIQIEFYTGIGQTAKTPVITQSLPVSIRNESVLIFDDIVDKGETLKLAIQYLGHHGAKDITTASLITKPWSHTQPDFVARQSEAWVIFPNEVREHIVLLSELWAEMGDDQAKVRQQLFQVGFSEAEVAMFAPVK